MTLQDWKCRTAEEASCFLKERELAERWQTSQRTLQRWRAEGTGPTYLRIEGNIRYRLSDIEDYEDRMLHAGSGVTPGEPS